MFDLLKVAVVCFTLAVIVLPIAFLICFSLPHNSEMRRICLQICYWGVAIGSIAYFAMPIDVIPDVLFPVGFADDLAALGFGYLNFKKATRPALTHPRD